MSIVLLSFLSFCPFWGKTYCRCSDGNEESDSSDSLLCL